MQISGSRFYFGDPGLECSRAFGGPGYASSVCALAQGRGLGRAGARSGQHTAAAGPTPASCAEGWGLRLQGSVTLGAPAAQKLSFCMHVL